MFKFTIKLFIPYFCFYDNDDYGDRSMMINRFKVDLYAANYTLPT